MAKPAQSQCLLNRIFKVISDSGRNDSEAFTGKLRVQRQHSSVLSFLLEKELRL